MLRAWALAAALVAATNAQAQSVAPQGATETAFDIAFREQCLEPVIAGRRPDEGSLPRRYFRNDRLNPKPPPGTRAWFAGRAEVHLLVDERGSCTVRVTHRAEPARLRALAVQAVRARPEGLSGGERGPALGGDGVRDFFCASVGAGTRSVVISTPTAARSRYPAIQATVIAGDTPCDAERNYL